MNSILIIAKTTFIGHIRNRIFWILILFGMLLLASSVIFSLLGQEQEIRMLTDLGLSAIEMLSFLTAVFLTVNLVLEEMKSKTIYLVLTRSVERSGYLLGKFVGLIGSVLVCFLVMSAAVLIVLLLKGWQFENDGALVLLSMLMSFEKIVLISSLGLFFSLFSTSGVAALAFTFFFWVLGHFAMELQFLASEIKSESARWLFKGIYFLIPHFQYLNARDLWIAVSERLPSFVFWGSVYTAVYSTFAFTLALLVFRKKEF